jgi:stage V sporulation protein AA
MSVQCADPAICAGIKNKTLYTFKKNDGQKKEGKKKKRMEVFSMLNVIERIQTDYPDVEIVSIGEQDFVVQLLDAPMAPKWLETLKVVVMVVVIFLGAAFTIMAFNNDVSVGEVFDRFYQQVMGKEKPKVSEIEIFYCLGLAVGILVFFNHIGKKKITSDPTPITRRNANVPAETAMPQAVARPAIKMCLRNIVFMPLSSRVLYKRHIDILFILSHLNLNRCRI